MPVTCTTSALAEAAKCFTCLSPADHAAIQTYLLAVIAGGSTDPATLLASAKCFTCVPDGELKRIIVKLLCDTANAGGGEPAEQRITLTATSEMGVSPATATYIEFNDDPTLTVGPDCTISFRNDPTSAIALPAQMNPAQVLVDSVVWVTSWFDVDWVDSSASYDLSLSTTLPTNLPAYLEGKVMGVTYSTWAEWVAAFESAGGTVTLA